MSGKDDRWTVPPAMINASTSNCTEIGCCNVYVCVFITQAHTTVLHISVFIPRSFQESLSEWGIWDKPQLETSYQPAVADVS